MYFGIFITHFQDIANLQTITVTITLKILIWIGHIPNIIWIPSTTFFLVFTLKTLYPNPDSQKLPPLYRWDCRTL